MTAEPRYFIHDLDGGSHRVTRCPDCLALILDPEAHAGWHARLSADLRAIADSAAMAHVMASGAAEHAVAVITGRTP